MNTTQTLLYDMARWMQKAEVLMINNKDTSCSFEVAEGRRLREQADRLVGFPRGVR